MTEGEGRQREEDLSALMDEVNTCWVLCRYVFERQSSLSKREAGGEEGWAGPGANQTLSVAFVEYTIIIYNHNDNLFVIHAVCVRCSIDFIRSSLFVTQTLPEP